MPLFSKMKIVTQKMLWRQGLDDFLTKFSDLRLFTRARAGAAVAARPRVADDGKRRRARFSSRFEKRIIIS
jgi:hypothetical protein